MPGAYLLGAAGISGISSLVGAGKGADAATSAARIQAQAGEDSIAFQRGVLQQIQQYVAPYINFGTGNLLNLQNVAGPDLAPVDTSIPTAPTFAPIDTSVPAPPAWTEQPIDLSIPDWTGGPPPTWDSSISGLEKTPGYQFALNEGLLAAQSGSAAAGLGRGGVSIQSATNMAEGTALSKAFIPSLTAFEDQFQNYEQTYGNYLSGVQNLQTQYQQKMQQQAQGYNQYNQDVGNLFTSRGLTLQQNQQTFNQYLANVQNKLAGGALQLQQQGQNYNISAGLAGLGLQGLSAGLGGAAGPIAQIGQGIQNVGAAQASGVVGAANAYNTGLTNVGTAGSSALNTYANYLQQQSLIQQQIAANNAGATNSVSNPITNPAYDTSNPLNYTLAAGTGGNPYGVS